MASPRAWSACGLAPVLAPVALALMAAAWSTTALADDRPFLRTTTAMVEDDDERVFEFSVTHQTGPKARDTQLQLGYSFSPTLSVEVELGQVRDKVEQVSSRERGLGLWMSWFDPAREGWGLASKLSLEREHEASQGWERPQYTGVMALSLPLADKSAWVHANVGTRYRSPAEDGLRRWTSLWSVAAQKELHRRFVLFAEAAGLHDRSDRLAQLGVRHWLKREKLAVDLGLGRQFAEARRGHFSAITLSMFDITP